MPVTINATAGAVTQFGAVTTITNTTLTVGAGATALLAWLEFANNSSTAISVTWDSGGTNQLMTLITSAGFASGSVYLYGLVRPTAGNMTLSSSWTTSGGSGLLDAMSFGNTAATSVAEAFTNANSGGIVASPSTLTIKGAPGNYSVCGISNNTSGYTVNLNTAGSSLFFNNSAGTAGQGAYAPSAASLVWTATNSGAAEVAMAGCTVAMAPAWPVAAVTFR